MVKKKSPETTLQRSRLSLDRFFEPRPWTSLASCKGLDTDIFYAETDDHEKKQKDQRAVTICGWCPVSTECLDYAISMGDEWGIWGGKTARQRGKIARERAKAADANNT